MLVDKMSDVGDLKISITETSGADLNLEFKNYATVSGLLNDRGLVILSESC